MWLDFASKILLCFVLLKLRHQKSRCKSATRKGSTSMTDFTCIGVRYLADLLSRGVHNDSNVTLQALETLLAYKTFPQKSCCVSLVVRLTVFGLSDRAQCRAIVSQPQGCEAKPNHFV